MTDQPCIVPAAPKSPRSRREGMKNEGTMGAHEPRLSDLLDDPVTRQVMASDRIELGDLNRLIARIRHHLAIRGLADSIAVRAVRQP